MASGIRYGLGDPISNPAGAPTSSTTWCHDERKAHHFLWRGYAIFTDSPTFLSNKRESLVRVDRDRLLGVNAAAQSPVSSRAGRFANATFYTSTVIDSRARVTLCCRGHLARDAQTDGYTRDSLGMDPPALDGNDRFSTLTELPNPGAVACLARSLMRAWQGARAEISEDTWHGGIAPRIGVAYALTLVR